jgi:penicillin-binding protein 1C
VFRDLVDLLPATEAPGAAAAAPAPPPPELLRIAVRFAPPVEPDRDEWFLRGTEMAVVHGADGGTTATPRIRYPAPDTVIAVDPDIAPGRQKVVFEAAPAVPGISWRLDGDTLPDDRGRAVWIPRPGRHTLALEDDSGRTLSQVAFEVRGDPAAVAP